MYLFQDQKIMYIYYNNMKTLLWLDDYRNPYNVNEEWLIFSPIKNPNTIWVKNYNDFINWILINGLPDAICFDHDLGEIYSGFDCAKWLVEYCIDNNLKLPLWNCQSANPVGRENINSLLNNYNKYYGSKNN